ncbi:uncharacterized protein EV422DRAFT_405161 [Fimicolochytrium jonesii]|uniref:uncharacterized protein n=1 Tax=Fimicolochytrium jonesii TaxID=1396493 RepID=UPI0022FEF396|nr:uncharacterized protein EV422DRAFT_405161 [Fimicolochytrium jonesii]KAI8822580.1 hypothetical protein EV422DRAFT_405161 [Fimicolochytrium jonesii]
MVLARETQLDSDAFRTNDMHSDFRANEGGSKEEVMQDDTSFGTSRPPTELYPQRSTPGVSSPFERDLMFLITRFLSGTTFQRTYNTLCEELGGRSGEVKEESVLPMRVDWMGQRHPLTYAQLTEENPHVLPDHLPRLFEKVSEAASSNESSLMPSLMSSKAALAMNLGLGATAAKPFSRRAIASQWRTRPIYATRAHENAQRTTLRFDTPLSIYYKRFERLLTTRGHHCAIFNGIFDKTGSVYITGGDDSLVKVWCAKTGYLMRTLRGHCTFMDTNAVLEHHVILDVALNDDNTLLATASSDETVQIWDTQSWHPLITLKIGKEITKIAFSPAPLEECKCFLVGAKDGKVRVYRWLPAEKNFELKPLILNTQDKRTDSVRTVVFDRIGSRFAVGGTDGFIHIYRILPKITEKPLQNRKAPPHIDNGSASESKITEKPQQNRKNAPHIDNGSASDPEFCVYKGKLDATSINSEEKPKRFGDIGVKELRFSHSGDRFASGCMDGTIAIYNYCDTTFKWEAIKLRAIVDTPTGASTESNTSTGQTADQPTAVPSTDAPQPLNGIGLPFLGLGSHPAPDTPHLDGTPEVGQVVNGATEVVPPAPIDSPPGSVAAVVPPTAVGEPEVSAEEVAGITALCWSLDDRKVITVTSDYHLRVWDSQNGDLLHVLQAHTSAVYNLDPHPLDPDIVLSASYDGKLIIWDISRGTELRRFEHERPLLDASFSPEGNLIGAADMAGLTHFFGTGLDPTKFTDYYEQFYPCDFTAVGYQDGILQDLHNSTLPHLVPMEYLVDARQSPYRIDYPVLKQDFALDRSLPIDTPPLVHDRKVRMFILDTRVGQTSTEQPFVWSQQEDKKRRKARPINTAPTEADREEMEALTSAEPIVPLPESSGEEFAGGEESSEGDESDSEGFGWLTPERENDDEFIDDSDDHGQGGSSSRPRRANGSKLNLRSKRKGRKRSRRDGRGPPRKRKRLDDDDNEDEFDDDEGPTRSSRRKVKRKSFKEYVSGGDDDDEFATDEDDLVVTDRKGKAAATSSSQRKSKKTKMDVVEEYPAGIVKPCAWVSTTDSKRSPYLPQIGDFVAYVKQGHIDFVKQAVDEGYKVDCPPGEHRGEVVYGVVDKLYFSPGEPVKCTLSLHVHDEEVRSFGPVPDRRRLTPVAKGGRKDILKVQFWDLDGITDFILLFEHYRDAVLEDWEEGAAVIVDYPDKPYDGRIQAIYPRESPWNKYLIRWDEGGEPLAVCPWELRKLDAELEDVPPERLSGDDMQRVCDIIDNWKSRDGMEFFLNEVDYETYPSYLTMIAYPMFVDLIRDRIRGGFYRRLEVCDCFRFCWRPERRMFLTT